MMTIMDEWHFLLLADVEKEPLFISFTIYDENMLLDNFYSAYGHSFCWSIGYLAIEVEHKKKKGKTTHLITLPRSEEHF